MNKREAYASIVVCQYNLKKEVDLKIKRKMVRNIFKLIEKYHNADD